MSRYSFSSRRGRAVDTTAVLSQTRARCWSSLDTYVNVLFTLFWMVDHSQHLNYNKCLKKFCNVIYIEWYGKKCISPTVWSTSYKRVVSFIFFFWITFFDLGKCTRAVVSLMIYDYYQHLHPDSMKAVWTRQSWQQYIERDSREKRWPLIGSHSITDPHSLKPKTSFRCEELCL